MNSSTLTSRSTEVVLALAIGLVGCAGAQKTKSSGRASADFALHDLAGNTVRLSDHRGKVVLINFWATWCGPCGAELPHLQRLYAKYRDQGVIILGISMDGPESVADVGGDVKRYGLEFPILLDEETRVVGVYNPKGAAPFSVLVDRDGTIAGTREGYSSGDEIALESEITALLAATADTKPVPIDVTSTTTVGWRSAKDDYGQLFEKLNLSGGTGSWQVAARADTATFASEPDPAIDDRYTLEKASVAHTGRNHEATIGDAYVSFGRGLALSLRKVDELGIDTTLRGAKTVARSDRLEATLVAGYANINNVDEATSLSTNDPYDLIGGLQTVVRVDGRHLVGIYGSGVAFHDSLGLAITDSYTDRIGQLGATFDSPKLAKDLGLYAEAMVQSVHTEPAAEDPIAYAAYTTATASRGRATLLVEGKSYGSLTPLNPRLDNPFENVAYNNPPTAERLLQPLENPQRNIAGGRARLDWRFTPNVVAYGNYGLFRDWLGYADPDRVGSIRDGTIHDPYAGLELRWDESRSWATAEAGYRLVTLEDSQEIVRGDGHGELHVVQAVNPCLGLTLQAIHRERKKAVSPILTETFREGTIDAGFRWRSSLAVSAGYDYTTEVTQPKRDYFHGNVAWDITPSSSVRLFAGSARGGLKCVSGVCRVFPPFEGVKLTLTLRY